MNFISLIIAVICFQFMGPAWAQERIDFTWGGESEIKGEAESMVATCQKMNSNQDSCLEFNFYRVAHRVIISQRPSYLPANRINLKPITPNQLKALYSSSLLPNRMIDILKFATDREQLQKKQIVTEETFQKLYYFLRFSLLPNQTYLRTGMSSVNASQEITFLWKDNKWWIKSPFGNTKLVQVDIDLNNDSRLVFYVYLNFEWRTFYINSGESLGQIVITEKKGTVSPIIYAPESLTEEVNE